MVTYSYADFVNVYYKKALFEKSEAYLIKQYINQTRIFKQLKSLVIN